MMTLSRVEYFSASHQLCNPKLSEKENQDIYGKCTGLHGHNYKLVVTIKGVKNVKLGWLMNAKELSNIIKIQVLDVLDHQHLNHILTDIPTAENVAEFILSRLKPHLVEFSLTVKLYETKNTFVTLVKD